MTNARANRLLAPLLAAAVPLVALPARAQCAPPGPTVYVSPGVLFSFALGPRQSFGIGAEMSYSRWPTGNLEKPAYGGFGNAVWYFTQAKYARLTAGAQGNYMLGGAEVGLSYSPATGIAGDPGGSAGPMLGAFSSVGFLMVALRGSIPVVGDDHGFDLSVDLGVKAPLKVEGRDLICFGSGRPLRVAGIPTLHEARPRNARRRAEKSCASLRSRARDALGDLWLRDARMEHASIAAFVRLARELAQLGAPASLVRRAWSAATDEIDHTRRCLAAAARYTETDWILDAFSSNELAPRTLSIEELVTESWEDGCLGEGVAADIAHLAARGCEDATSRSDLLRVAEDEGRHRELAWDVLAWCTSLKGDDGKVARDCLEVARSNAEVRLEDETPLPASLLRARGRLPLDAATEAARLHTKRARARAAKLVAKGSSSHFFTSEPVRL